MTASLLLAKLTLLGVLATFLPLFLGFRRWRRPLAAALVVATAALVGFSAVALRGSSLTLAAAQGSDAAAPAASTVPVGASLASRLPLLAALAAVTLVALALLTWLAYRYPAWALPAMVVVMPLRVPLPTSDGSVKLLIPLYLVTAAVLGAEVMLRDRLRPPATAPREPLRVALAVFIAVVGVSALWAGLSYAPHADGFAAAVVKLFAFYLPFAVVYALVYRHVATPQALRRLLATMVGLGAVLSLVGIAQYATHTVFFNKAAIVREQSFGHGFRVNSLFWDPNMFSRFLIMVMLLCVALMVVTPLWRRRLAAVAVLAAAANLFTLSRSGWLALFAGLILFGYAWLGRKRGTVALVVLVVLFGGGLAVLAETRHVELTWGKLQHPWGINRLTGGRYYLAQAAGQMFEDHPLGGVGLGAFHLAYPEYRDRHAGKRLTESHTTPFTVAAEQGVPGLLAYLALLGLYVATALRAGPRAADRPLRLVRAGLLAVALAFFVHSLLYNAYFEDPFVWAVFALSMAAVYRLRAWGEAMLPQGKGTPATADVPRRPTNA